MQQQQQQQASQTRSSPCRPRFLLASSLLGMTLASVGLTLAGEAWRRY
jgi:hypothetical protein